MAPTGITIRLHKCPSTINEDGRVLDFHPKQNYWKLKEEYLRKGELFTDPYFKASSESLGRDNWLTSIDTWKRPKDICKYGTPKFMHEGMTRHDVLQIGLGDCWFMAAAASLTFRPELLERVVPPDQSFDEGQYAGIFHFQFWHNGRWVDVVVDDLLPVDQGGLRFAGFNDDFWMPLLEKAYAKLNGSYEAIHGGQINQAFLNLTGGIVQRVNPKYDKKLFEIIEMALERKSLLGATIFADGLQGVDAKGLRAKHAYSITETYKLIIEGKKERLVKLRNPWGHTEWTGKWNDRSEMWSKVDFELQKKLIGEKAKDDGEFWMELGDFKLRFDQVDICHLSINTLKQEEDHYFWKPTTHHGCLNKDENFWNNPQYIVSLREPDEAEWDLKGKKYQLQKSICHLIVSLMQNNQRKGRRLPLFLDICQVPKEVTKESLKQMTTTQKRELLSKFRNGNRIIGGYEDITDISQMPPGNYMIIPFTTSQYDGAEFILRIFTETKHECLELDDEISADEKTLHVEKPPKTGVNQMMDKTFQQYASQDKKIGTAQFKEFMNHAYICGQEQQKDGFSMEDCQKIIQHFDESGTGRLTRDTFMQCVTKINEWAGIFTEYDADVSGTMDAYELCNALEAAGFHVNYQTINVLLKKCSNPFHQICFDKFVTCLVLLESAFRKVKYWGTGNLPEKMWLELIE